MTEPIANIPEVQDRPACEVCAKVGKRDIFRLALILVIVFCLGSLTTTVIDSNTKPIPKPKPAPTVGSGSWTEIGATSTSGPIVFPSSSGTMTFPIQAKEPDYLTEPAGPKPIDSPPAKVKVGPYYYKIMFRKNLGGAFGMQYPKMHVILLKSGMPDDSIRETLEHEIFHACREVSDWYEQSEGDDRFIESVAPTFLQVIQDNPELMAWFQRHGE